MLDYVISLLKDVNDFSWSGDKSWPCHVTVSNGATRNFGFSQGDKIDRNYRANVQKHIYHGHMIASVSLKMCDLCYAISIMRTHEPMTEHMRHVTWFAGTCAKLVLPIGKVLTILKCFRIDKKYNKNE